MNCHYALIHDKLQYRYNVNIQCPTYVTKKHATYQQGHLKINLSSMQLSTPNMAYDA